jgi:hypothetical protein
MLPAQTGFTSSRYALSLQAFSKAAARAAQGPTVMEKMPCQRMRDQAGGSHSGQIWEIWATQTATNWSGWRTAQPWSIQRLGTIKIQGQRIMGHSYASGVKVRGRKCGDKLCALEICISTCTPIILPQHTHIHTPTRVHTHTHIHKNLHICIVLQDCASRLVYPRSNLLYTAANTCHLNIPHPSKKHQMKHE